MLFQHSDYEHKKAWAIENGNISGEMQMDSSRTAASVHTRP